MKLKSICPTLLTTAPEDYQFYSFGRKCNCCYFATLKVEYTNEKEEKCYGVEARI